MAALLVVATLKLLTAFLLVQYSQALIECVCTTQECLREGETTCLALQWCYVEILPREGATSRATVHRGCIDDRTPLLCENRARPLSYLGSWPVLHCCQDELCNKDVLPTIPSWREDLENNPKLEEPESGTQSYFPWVEGGEEEQEEDEYEEEPLEDPNLDSYQHQGEIQRDFDHFTNMKNTENKINTDTTTKYKSRPIYDQTRRKLRPKTQSKHINPIYIAVPALGACILLTLIIFVIFLLKRQNQHIEKFRYHSTLRYPGEPCILSRDPRVTCTHCACARKQLYAECERSSSGSETKLLMKV